MLLRTDGANRVGEVSETTESPARPRWRRSRMLLWVLLLGPLGIVAYYYRWARLTFLVVVGSIWIYGGGRVGLIVGLAFFALPAAALARRFLRGIRWYLALRNE